MPLEFDPMTGDIRFEGKVIGRYTADKGIGRVTFNITYECSVHEWVVPLSWFGYGLNLLSKYQNAHGAESLDIKMSADAIESEFPAIRYLTEKTVKTDGFIWQFHKSDPDTWPSLLHGHDYERSLVLDGITGDIFDSATKQLCKKLKQKELLKVQEELRRSKDFKAAVETHVDGKESSSPQI